MSQKDARQAGFLISQLIDQFPQPRLLFRIGAAGIDKIKAIVSDHVGVCVGGGGARVSRHRSQQDATVEVDLVKLAPGV